MPIPKPKKGEIKKEFNGTSNQRSAKPTKENDMAETKYETGYFDCIAEIKATQNPDTNDESKGEFTGYASIFGNKDLGNDVVQQGAFSKSIAEKGAKGVKMLYQHKADTPIGVFDEILEDTKGLRVKGRLAMATQKGKEVYELMKMGALSGLSIGYRVEPKGYTYSESGKKRTLKAVDLMEISAVTFPMNTRALVSAVKGSERTIREWEDFLRDEGNLSRTEAKRGASALTKALTQRDVDEESQILNAIQRLNETILKGE
jgi:HK97 family phage prohead protease